MHKASYYIYTIVIRGLAEVCILQNAIKIKLQGGILMVIIHSKFCINKFLTFQGTSS